MAKSIKAWISRLNMKQIAPRSLDPDAGLSVVLLGTGTPLPNPARACASTLILAGNMAFLVDTGRGFLNNFAMTGLLDVDAVFFTHYHSDHFGEFGEFMVTRTIWGAYSPLQVFGPAGAEQTLGTLIKAYNLDTEYRKAHHGEKWNDEGMNADIHEVLPGVIYDQGGVKVTMFPVDHPPVKPAMGYRFDYKHHAVVISGDTRKTPEMERMAQGADVLIHEVANKQMVDIARGSLDSRLESMSQEMLAYHTSTREVAEIAAATHVKRLVLTHLLPVLPRSWFYEKFYTRGMARIFKGKIIVGRDRMVIDI